MSTEYQKTSEHKSYCVSKGVAHDKARKIKKKKCWAPISKTLGLILRIIGHHGKALEILFTLSKDHSGS